LFYPKPTLMPEKIMRAFSMVSGKVLLDIITKTSCFSKKKNNIYSKLVSVNFMVAPCINNIKHFIVQLKNPWP